MPEKTFTNGQVWWRQVATGFLTAVFAGGGVFGYMHLDPPRPDPYTSIMAREDFSQVRMQVQNLNERLHDLAIQLSKLPPKEWQDRIRKIELDWAKHEAEHNKQ